MKLVLLAGGTGAAKLAVGLAGLMPASDLTIIANTADDEEFWGLHVSPDIDAILYRLSGCFNDAAGFGVRDDTFNALETLGRMGEPTWFGLGDRDIGLHLLRTSLLQQGLRLSEATALIAGRMGVQVDVVPMSDDAVRTRIRTEAGELSLQQWFVERRCTPPALGVRYAGADTAAAAPEALRALTDADAVVIGPSNPLLSVDPILAVLGGAVDAARTIAVSPVVGGRSLKGPTTEMLRQCGEEPTALGVARHYAGTASVLVLDTVDAALQQPIAGLGVRPIVCDTVMVDAAGRRRLAEAVLRVAESLGSR